MRRQSWRYLHAGQQQQKVAQYQGKSKEKHGWISFFNVDYCLFKLQNTRASDRVDLSAVVQRLGIASLEMGCWGQMIWKIP